MNKRYNIQLEVLTPLAVGAGTDNNWNRGTDYIIKDNKVYVLDLEKSTSLGFDVDDLSDLLFKSDEEGLIDLFGDRLVEVSRHVFDLPTQSTNPIYAFLRNQFHNKPLVPGSSLKGPIRSALFNHFRGDNDTSEEYVFGNMKQGTEFMRFIQVGDIEMESTNLVNTKIFNLWKDKDKDVWYGGWKHGEHFTDQSYNSVGFNTLYECVPPGSIGQGTLKFVSDAFHTRLLSRNIEGKIRYPEVKSELLDGGIDELFRIINDHTWEYLKKEEAFFDKYRDAERSEDILLSIDELFNIIPQDEEYSVMKLSAGSGFHSITGDWQFNNYIKTGYRIIKNGNKENKIPKYKSRKIAEYDNGLFLMGFVKLTRI